ncbi:single-stranded DNA-binding protein [Staphylococcus americanisciuri]|uniref:Single-stranded DNA-binding protein n=1 Tax=Staphylococcus americanisciuri TaxID=2973940 RepID=A0ABT2F3T2_9STAP|nr:single-stranded DNA-binding protein [Staphylococcus americanisciuri]MCS4487042.1 single-stranded DNA-binding protein [Staphylococcus americanisciuri]
MIIINHIKAIGTVTKAPKYYEKPGSQFISFFLAVERSFKGKDDRPIFDYLNCKAFGPVAIQIDQEVAQGDMISIEGYLTTRRYQFNDEKRFSTEIVVESVEKIEVPPSLQLIDMTLA